MTTRRVSMPAYYNEIDGFAAAWLRALADANVLGSGEGRIQRGRELGRVAQNSRAVFAGVALGDADGPRSQGQPELSATGGDQCAVGTAGAFDIWRDPEWIYCTDGKYRPTQPGLSPLADGIPARVGRLRGYGNAIVPQLAATFIKAYTEVREL